MIDRDIHRARALLIESNPLLRSVGVAMLRDVGIGHVATATRCDEARLLLEREPFHIVICEREGSSEGGNGQDLLDELRRERLLPQSAVFLMTAQRAEYNQVVEAAEAALDGFLLRPYTAAALAERLALARQRKRELSSLLEALDRGDTDAALIQAVRRFQERMPYWAWSGRLAAELLLARQRPAEALRLFDALSGATGTPAWAQLGRARALLAAGDAEQARRLLTELLEADPRAADAHDLIGRLFVDQSDFAAALVHYRQAAEITPGCLLRNQHAGALAFYQGDEAEALLRLLRAIGLGMQSKLFDALSMMLLALLHFDRADADGCLRMQQQLRAWRERHPASRRLQRFERAASILGLLLKQESQEAQRALQELAGAAHEPAFDLEAANLLLALWARLPAQERDAAAHAALVEQLSLRFANRRAVAEVLVAAARREPAVAAAVRRTLARNSMLGARELERARQGGVGAAMRALLEEGQRTLNRQWFELAGDIALRHGRDHPEAEALKAEAGAWLERLGGAQGQGSHIAGIQRSGRSPGALLLRTPSTLTPQTEAA